MKSTRDLQEQARKVRKHILDMTHASGASHVGTALSCADILVAIYAVARIDPKHPLDPKRDRVILSKGHGVTAWYGILAEKGFFPVELLKTYYQDGSPLTGHPDIQGVPGIETTTGSLGHGLPVGIGMALAARIDERPSRVFVVLGDGECNEGTIWEAALAASHLRLRNLTVVVDRNHQQGLGTTEEIANLEPFEEKWHSFGWDTKRVNGHDIPALVAALQEEHEKPLIIIAETTKGKGVSFMENQVLWHYRNPNKEQHAQALKELGIEGEQ